MQSEQQEKVGILGRIGRLQDAACVGEECLQLLGHAQLIGLVVVHSIR